MFHCNTAVTHEQHIACFLLRQHVMICLFLLRLWRNLINSLAELAMYANLWLLVAPAICAFALLAQFLPAPPTSKTDIESSVIMLASQTYRKFRHTGHHSILCFTRKIRRTVAPWCADAARSRRRAAHMQLLSCFSQAHISVVATQSFFSLFLSLSHFFVGGSSETCHFSVFAAKLRLGIAGKHNPWRRKLAGTTNDQP